MKQFHVRRRYYLIFAAVLSAVVTSQSFAQQRLFDMQSVATNDGLLSPIINPAAPAFGNAGGIGAVVGYDEHTFSSISEPTAPDATVLLNSSLLSYAFQKTGNDGLHTGTLSAPLFGDMYAGVGVSTPDFSFEDPFTRVGLLYRPVNVLSIGGTTTIPETGDPAYRVGGALRPLFVDRELAQSLTVSADVRYQNDELGLPVARLEMTPQDGLDIAAGYDFENDRFQLQASVSYGSVRSGSSAGFTADRGVGATVFTHFATRDFRSFAPVDARTFAEYAPGPVVVEQPSFVPFRNFRDMDPTQTVSEIIRDVRRLAQNDAVAGVLFRNHNLQASYANFLELQSALSELKATGKKVVFYFEQTNTLNYALAASVADEIYLNPNGSVGLSGLSRTRPYLKGALDEFGIEVANIRSHAYKTRGNTFSETGMSPEEREALGALLEDQYGVLLRMLEDGRGDRLTDSADAVVADGPYLVAERALEAGLVDDLIYEDEIEDRLDELHAGARTAEVSARDQIRYQWSRKPAPQVAVIYATGNIIRGEGQSGQLIGSKTMARAIRRARQAGNIDGIVLRISSGGGSSLASGVIAREVALTTEGENAKPVVVSMADSAASGGYYIAAPADKIVAHPVTVTGSIGVVTLLPNIEGLSEQYDVNWDTVKTTESADLGALYRRLTESEREQLQNSIDAEYERFVDTVAEHRDMSTESVDDVARGRVWSGEDALENGLVDRLGGFATAIDVMKELLETDTDPRLVEVFPAQRPFGFVRVDEWIASQARSQLDPELQNLLEAQRELSRYGEEMILMLAEVEAGNR